MRMVEDGVGTAVWLIRTWNATCEIQAVFCEEWTHVGLGLVMCAQNLRRKCFHERV